MIFPIRNGEVRKITRKHAGAPFLFDAGDVLDPFETFKILYHPS